jgi:hypothetical protein
MKSDLANVMIGMLVPLVSGSESEAAVNDAEQHLCSIHSSPLPSIASQNLIAKFVLGWINFWSKSDSTKGSLDKKMVNFDPLVASQHTMLHDDVDKVNDVT